MNETQDDYARTDQLDDALIPIALIREQMSVSERTLSRRLAGIDKHRFGRTGTGNPGREWAVRWGDIKHLFTPSTRQM